MTNTATVLPGVEIPHYGAFRILLNAGVDPDGRTEYLSVYVGAVCYLGPTWYLLERIFERFNVAHPEGYAHPSLSVGDVIVLPEGDAWRVEGYGFERITEAPSYIVAGNELLEDRTLWMPKVDRFTDLDEMESDRIFRPAVVAVGATEEPY